jgi:hypothetical protein
MPDPVYGQSTRRTPKHHEGPYMPAVSWSDSGKRWMLASLSNAEPPTPGRFSSTWGLVGREIRPHWPSFRSVELRLGDWLVAEPREVSLGPLTTLRVWAAPADLVVFRRRPAKG